MSICAASRRVPAPSAIRTAISRRRASERAGEEQVGHVDAGDQKHDRDGGQEEHERLLGTAHECVAEGHEEVGGRLIALWILALELAGDRRDLTAGFRDRPVRGEAPDREEPPRFPLLRRLDGDGHRGDDVGLGVRGKLETRGSDADDEALLIVDLRAAAHHGGVPGETILPEIVSQEHDLPCPRAGVAGLDPAAENRPDTEGVEGARGHHECRHPERIAHAEDRRLSRAVRAEGIERLLPAGEVHVVAEGVERLGDSGALVAVVQGDEPVGLGVAEGPEKHRLHHGEDRDVGAHAERERQHRGEGEARLANEPPGGMAQVVEEHRHRTMGFHQRFRRDCNAWQLSVAAVNGTGVAPSPRTEV